MEAEMEAEFQAKRMHSVSVQSCKPMHRPESRVEVRKVDENESKKLQELFDKETTSSTQQYPVEHLSSSDEDDEVKESEARENIWR